MTKPDGIGTAFRFHTGDTNHVYILISSCHLFDCFGPVFRGIFLFSFGNLTQASNIFSYPVLKIPVADPEIIHAFMDEPFLYQPKGIEWMMFVIGLHGATLLGLANAVYFIA